MPAQDWAPGAHSYPLLARQERATYPFTAIVGQEEMKLALLLNVIEPRIGGVLIMGHRGTGKSTAVRALADLLPQARRVSGCLYGCDPEISTEWCDGCLSRRNGRRSLPSEWAPVPVVELPLGATEDRVCGTLDIELALARGIKAFEPGLLAKAHRGFLYIDEVNLLEDHLVDLLLDVAASGWNVVEREGISVRHPSRIVLVGSGNPDEGELRPQLLDRFGLYARASTIGDIAARMEIVRRRERFECDPVAFRAEVAAEQERLRRRIQRARRLISGVEMESGLLTRASELCVDLGADGHRGELTILRASKALAAFEGRQRVGAGDVRRVTAMSLRHRLAKNALGDVDPGVRIELAMNRLLPANELETHRNGHWRRTGQL